MVIGRKIGENVVNRRDVTESGEEGSMITEYMDVWASTKTPIPLPLTHLKTICFYYEPYINGLKIVLIL